MKTIGYTILSLFLCFLIVLGFLLPGMPQAYAMQPQPVEKVVEGGTGPLGPNGQKYVVSLGDSYSSGEGIEDFYDFYYPMTERRTKENWLAHRSENAWAGMLHLANMPKGMSLKNYRDETWFFVASSGAVTDNIRYTGGPKKGNSHPYEGEQEKEYNRDGIKGNYYLPGQLDIFNKLGKGTVSYVTMTIGGNDVGFGSVVTAAVVGGTYLNVGLLSNMINSTWIKFFWKGGIKDQIREAYYRVHEAAGDQATILIGGYPKLFDRLGRGLPINIGEATIINDAVTKFNNQLEKIVRSCQSDMKIKFIPVEQAFDGHEAYSDLYDLHPEQEYLNPVYFGSKRQDLDEKAKASAYSMHPNIYGAQVYARLFNEVLASIDQKVITNDRPNPDPWTEPWTDPPTTSGQVIRETSGERDIVLVLDTSGSMEGQPLRETRRAAERFVQTILQEDASIGLVTFDYDGRMLADFSKDESYLVSMVNSLYAGGSTNTDEGLQVAERMLMNSSARKKIIVLMSDGEPNRGREGTALIDYANELKQEGILIYTLGFFSDLSYKYDAQSLMEQIASEGCHFEVDDADNLVYFFGDVADQINGQRYIYIRIACPVDVVVSAYGETLASAGMQYNTRTSFGSLTFEDNDEVSYGAGDTRTKVLRLKEEGSYKVQIYGNGEGVMNYTMGVMDANGEYSDVRTIPPVSVSRQTYMEGDAKRNSATTLRVDYNGDGRFDQTFSVGGPQGPSAWLIVLLCVGAIGIAALVFLLLRRRRRMPAMTGPVPGMGYTPVPSVNPARAANPTAPRPLVQTPTVPTPAAPPVMPKPVPTTPAAPPAPKREAPTQELIWHGPQQFFHGAGEDDLGGTETEEKPAASTFCVKCGKPLQPNERFCGNCGAPNAEK